MHSRIWSPEIREVCDSKKDVYFEGLNDCPQSARKKLYLKDLILLVDPI